MTTIVHVTTIPRKILIVCIFSRNRRFNCNHDFKGLVIVIVFYFHYKSHAVVKYYYSMGTVQSDI